MEWHKDRLNKAISVLRDSDSVKGAAEELSYIWGQAVTSAALRGAFRRADLESPSSYIGQKDVDIDFDVPERKITDWTINDDESEYVFNYLGTDIRLSFSEMEKAILLYADHEPGKGYTAKEVAQHFQNFRSDLSADFFEKMFRTINYIKSMFPHAPHQVFKDKEHVINQVYNRSDALIKRNDSRNIIKEQQKRIETLQDELVNLTTLVGEDSTIGEEQVRQINIDSQEDESKILFIPVCDLHNGKKVEDHPLSKEQNIFNREIFWQRILYICHLIQNQGENKSYEKVIIGGLGDYFEALLLNMRRGHHVRADNYGKSQYNAVKQAYALLIKTVLNTFDCEVMAYVQGGNHDRLTKDKAPESEDTMAYMLSEHIKDLFKHTEYEDRLEVSFGAGIVSLLLDSGLNLLTLHGHKKSIKSSSQSEKLINIHGYPQADRYLIIQAHWHSFKVVTGYNYKNICMPSVCGNDRYNLEHINQGAPPEFLMVEFGQKDENLIGPFNLHNASDVVSLEQARDML